MKHDSSREKNYHSLINRCRVARRVSVIPKQQNFVAPISYQQCNKTNHIEQRNWPRVHKACKNYCEDLSQAIRNIESSSSEKAIKLILAFEKAVAAPPFQSIVRENYKKIEAMRCKNAHNHS
jgi:hypothetical protein